MRDVSRAFSRVCGPIERKVSETSNSLVSTIPVIGRAIFDPLPQPACQRVEYIASELNFKTHKDDAINRPSMAQRIKGTITGSESRDP